VKSSQADALRAVILVGSVSSVGSSLASQRPSRSFEFIHGPVLDVLGDAVESIEEAMFSDQGIDSAEEVYNLKRQVQHFLGATRPLKRPLEALAAGKVPVEGEPVYFRDILDNLTRMVDRAETYRELLTTAYTPTSRKSACSRTKICATCPNSIGPSAIRSH
jgi:hypothetical protein